MSVGRQTRCGFTLVELLVVIVIIGMLAGLLIPAVQSARQSAVRTKCINYQEELGKALLQYESAKQRFPGYINQIKNAKYPGGVKDVSWAVVTFEYLGRNDLWETWRDGSPKTVQVAQMACPADAQALVARDDALSYVVNPRIFRNRGADAYDPANANKPAYKTISLSDIKSAQQTVLLSERLALGNGWSNATSANHLTFRWTGWKTADPQARTPTISFTGAYDANNAFVKSNHPGGVVVTFCDGHVEFVLNDAQCKDYQWGPLVK